MSVMVGAIAQAFFGALWLVSWPLKQVARGATRFPDFASEHTAGVVAAAVLVVGLALYGFSR